MLRLRCPEVGALDVFCLVVCTFILLLLQISLQGCEGTSNEFMCLKYDTHSNLYNFFYVVSGYELPVTATVGHICIINYFVSLRYFEYHVFNIHKNTFEEVRGVFLSMHRYESCLQMTTLSPLVQQNKKQNGGRVLLVIIYLSQHVYCMCLFVHISNSLLVTTCSLSSNSTYSLKCEKEDAELDVIELQNLEQLSIIVRVSWENSLKLSGMLRPMEGKMHLMTLGTREDRHGTAVVTAEMGDVGDDRAFGELSMPPLLHSRCSSLKK